MENQDWCQPSNITKDKSCLTNLVASMRVWQHGWMGRE